MLSIDAIRFDDYREQSNLSGDLWHHWEYWPHSIRQEDPPFDETLEPMWTRRASTFFETLRKKLK